MASPETNFDFLDEPSQPGDLGTLSHYRVIDELGRGGMGFVFRAQDKRLQRDVALKVMNQKVAMTPYSRKRFLHEARAMAAVHHDNVATIFEVGEKRGTPYMAMEMLKGSTLEDFNKKEEQLDYKEVIRYANQMAMGLAAAHAKGIVHRDIKPANIWIESGTDRVKILDFGLALAATPVDQLAGRGAVIGTPGYLSPEQARTEPLDDRSDLYSLGVVLYELCTGCLPLRAGTVPEQLIAILAHRPRPMLHVNPNIPVPLADLIHQLLFKEPRARVSSATTLLKELERVEVECQAKTEVAQTINKLQAGLSAVVSKQSEPSFDGVLDPFAAMPDMPAAPSIPGSKPTVGPSAKPSGPVPRHSKPTVGASPYQRPSKTASNPQPNWQKYLPIAAIAAVVLLALPVMTFAFSMLGGGDEPVLVTQQTSNHPNANPNQNKANNKNNASDQANRNAQNGNKQNKNGGQTKNAQQGKNANGTGQANRNPQNKNRQGKNNRNANNKAANNSGNANNGNANNNAARRTAGYSSGISNDDRAGSTEPNPKRTGNRNNKNAQQRSGNTANSNNPTQGNAKPNAANNRNPQNPGRSNERVAVSTSNPSAGAANREMLWSKISTAVGRGADTMVQIGTSTRSGTKPSIGIHQRGDIESHHSYLRFDLAAINDVKSEAKNVELILTMVGKSRPEGATIRLVGIPGKNLAIWPEEGPRSPIWSNTPSKNGLQTLPVLASVTVTSKTDPRDGKKNAIRLSSPELTAFVRDSADETINLILAGDSNGAAPLRFVSRQGSKPENAPTLAVEAPKEPAKKNRQQRR